MATRTDVDVTYSTSPRVLEIKSPSVEMTMQDLVDTTRKQEDTFEGMSYKKLLNASGKEDLGGGVQVGITVAMQDTLIAFEGRTTPAQIGTVTDSPAAIIIGQQKIEDTSATFITNEIHRGSLVINFTDHSIAEVISIDSEIQLTTKTLVNGTLNTYVVGNDYQVFNIEQVTATGGNLTAVDGTQTSISSILPTAFTQVLLTAASSATTSGQAQLEYGTFNGGVTLDVAAGAAGTAYPRGTPGSPVNNMTDAQAIAIARGLRSFFVRGDITLGAETNVSGFEFIGQSSSVSTITINTAANVVNCEFRDAAILGTLDGGSSLEQCSISTLNFVDGGIFRCTLKAGTVTLSGVSTAIFDNCQSGVVGASTPIIDMNGSGSPLGMRHYAGGIELRNKTGNDPVSLDLDSGQVIIDSSVTDATPNNIIIRGLGKLTNNALNPEVIDSTNFLQVSILPSSISDAVWDETLADHVIVGSSGEALGNVSAGASPSAIADAVWDETLVGHVAAGSAGETLGNVDASQLSFEHAVYNDKVVFDPSNSTGLAASGTTFPAGTSLQPSLTLADVITICNARGFSLIQVKQSATITSTPSVDNFRFEGDNRSATILTFVAADTGDTAYNHIHLEGGMSGGADINNCTIGSITGVGCTVNDTTIADTLIEGSIVLRADNNQPLTMVNCGSINGAQVVLDLNGTTGNIAILNYTDRIRIINMTAALSIHVSSAAGCELTVDASCTAVTTFEVHGNVNIINQSNLTIDDDTTHALIWEQPTSVIVPGSMGQLVNYLGYVDKQVHFDADALNGGTGTQLAPFNTLADTVDYAETNNIKDLVIYSDIIVDRNLKNFRITGIGVPEVDANGQDLLNSEFHRVKFKGAYTSNVILQESVLLNGAYLNGFFENCSIAGDLICVDGSNNFVKNCASGIAGLGRPSISMNATGTTKLNLRGYQGGMTIKDCNAATDELSMSLSPGSVTFDASCTNGVMVARGIGTFIDNSNGATVTDEVIQKSQITAVQVDVTNILATVDEVRKYDKNRTKIDAAAFTMTIYDDNGTTPIKVFDLKDENGVASITQIFERIPQ